MKFDIDQLAPDEAGAAYLSDIDRRMKQARRMIRSRSFGIQISWVIVLVAGASVSVVEVLGWPRWVSGLLGLTVVVFQGAERLFARTAHGFEAIDILRRGLAREIRLMTVSEGHYRGVEEPFSVFVMQCEALIEANDVAEIEYNAELAGRTSKD